jgi:hypothetical protein
LAISCFKRSPSKFEPLKPSKSCRINSVEIGCFWIFHTKLKSCYFSSISHFEWKNLFSPHCFSNTNRLTIKSHHKFAYFRRKVVISMKILKPLKSNSIDHEFQNSSCPLWLLPYFWQFITKIKTTLFLFKNFANFGNFVGIRRCRAIPIDLQGWTKTCCSLQSGSDRTEKWI